MLKIAFFYNLMSHSFPPIVLHDNKKSKIQIQWTGSSEWLFNDIPLR